MVTQQEISEMIQRIKQEPVDEELQSSSKTYNNSPQRRKRKITEDFQSNGQKKIRHLSENGNPTIPCLMCDRYLENQDELMIHMALDHQCSPQGNRRQVGRIPKHTCQICFAKFRTLRDLFTHTAFHAKQMQINGDWATDVGTRIEKSLARQGTIRQYFSNIQNNLSSEIQHGTFKCDCCNTVFMNRDTYAMHVMMRVKDEMCKQDDMCKTRHLKDVTGEYGNAIGIPPQNGQEYLIDVTSSEIEDEYLKSALSATNTEHQKSKEDHKGQRIQGKKCIFCTEYFLDQDAMAMHVMSVHSNANSQTLSRNVPGESYRSRQQQNNAELVSPTRMLYRCNFCGNTFESRNSLTMHSITNHSDENDNIKKRHQIGKEIKNTEHSGEKCCITVTEISDIQEEPLNLASEKKTFNQNLTVQKEEKSSDQKGNSDITSEWHVESASTDREERLTRNRRTRSASLPDVRQNEAAYQTRNRPASTGGIRTGDILTESQNNSLIVENRNSPVSYSYEHPDTYVEEREHSCQYIGVSQNDPLELLLQKREQAHVCSYCEIIFLNRTLYYLHMGLHNVNNPLQCNMCGKTCDNIHDFSVHVMHL